MADANHRIAVSLWEAGLAPVTTAPFGGGAHSPLLVRFGTVHGSRTASRAPVSAYKCGELPARVIGYLPEIEDVRDGHLRCCGLAQSSNLPRSRALSSFGTPIMKRPGGIRTISGYAGPSRMTLPGSEKPPQAPPLRSRSVSSVGGLLAGMGSAVVLGRVSRAQRPLGIEFRRNSPT